MMHHMATDLAVKTRDIVIAAVLSVLGIGLMVLNVADPAVGGNASIFAVPTFLVLTAPLAWRRAAPTTALAATFAALLAHVALFGSMTRCGVMFPAVFILVFANAAFLHLRPALLGLALALALVVVMSVTDRQIAIVDAPLFCGLSAAFWGIGRLVRSRSRLVDALDVQTDELRSARDERARLEVVTDRARLSVELEGLLQRRLGELARIVDAAPSDGDPRAATASLAEIERQGRHTLEQLRAVVGVLRNEPGDAPTAPPPTLTHLDAMLVRVKGADARLTVEGNPRALPAGVELSAYRIVEHLLGALDDRRDVDVRVRFAGDALELTITGSRRRGSRGAIERARERTRLHHGSLKAIVRDGRIEAVALLPVATAS